MKNNNDSKQNTEAIVPEFGLENSFFDNLSVQLDFDLSEIVIYFLAGINVVFVILIIASLFLNTSMGNLSAAVNNANNLLAVKISIFSLLISITITVLIGVPFSYVVSQSDNKINKIVNLFIKLPLVMPPTVAGLALLLTFGKQGIFNNFLNAFNLNLPFTFTALIIVQIFVMLPLFTQSVKNGFEVIDPDIREAAMIFGAGEKDILLKIYLPLSIKPLLTGIIMACLRAAGEFGATMMFAGNLSGKTQTLPTAIYIMVQRDLNQAVALAVILIIIFLLPIIFLETQVKGN